MTENNNNNNNNIIYYPKCKALTIQEEIEIHKCFKELNNALFDTDGIFSFDGKKWYTWFPEWTVKSPPTQNQRHLSTL